VGCHSEAPGLVQTYRKFKDRGVSFLSVTNGSRQSAETYVKEFGIPWPCLYRTPPETLQALGAFPPEMNEKSIGPVVYLVAADGTVLWHDHRARLHHQDKEQSVWLLEKAIEAQLHAMH
jgi:peroxiredoxin